MCGIRDIHSFLFELVGFVGWVEGGRRMGELLVRTICNDSFNVSFIISLWNDTVSKINKTNINMATSTAV